MSSKKSSKWSSSSSLSKFFSRLTRTLSFSSKKSQQTFKTKSTKIPNKNINIVPQSAPIIRRQLPVTQRIVRENFNQPIIYPNMYEENDIDEDYDQYSLRPNLSLFNISLENLHCQSVEFYRDDREIFHSTKIGEY